MSELDLFDEALAGDAELRAAESGAAESEAAGSEAAGSEALAAALADAAAARAAEAAEQARNERLHWNCGRLLVTARHLLAQKDSEIARLTARLELLRNGRHEIKPSQVRYIRTTKKLELCFNGEEELAGWLGLADLETNPGDGLPVLLDSTALPARRPHCPPSPHKLPLEASAGRQRRRRSPSRSRSPRRPYKRHNR